MIWNSVALSHNFCLMMPKINVAIGFYIALDDQLYRLWKLRIILFQYSMHWGKCTKLLIFAQPFLKLHFWYSMWKVAPVSMLIWNAQCEHWNTNYDCGYIPVIDDEKQTVVHTYYINLVIFYLDLFLFK